MMPAAAHAATPLRSTPLERLHPATRLGAAVLGLVCVMTVPAPVMFGILVALSAALAWTGLPAGRQLSSLRAWLPVVLVVLLVHTLTTTAAAPLGHPSLAGVLTGAIAVARVAGSVGWLALLMRTSTLDDLVAAVGWWLRPLRMFGVSTADLGLALAVALGTAPLVAGEGRRVLAVVRLRRRGPAALGVSPWAVRSVRNLQDRARVVVPLLEALGRRAESLSLVLRERRLTATAPPMPVWQASGLVIWSVVLILGLVAGARAG